MLNEESLTLVELRKQVLLSENVQLELDQIRRISEVFVTSHKSATLPMHKLVFLLEMGLTKEVDDIRLAITEILKNKSDEGIYQSLMIVPIHFGGSGDATYSWALCDAPLLLYILLLADMDYEQYIKRGVESIVSMIQDNGFPCVVSKKLGKFRGPGKKSDCCPYATLVVLKMLSVVPTYHNSDIVKRSIDQILMLFTDSLALHPYMFYMGTDFRKLKAPTLWYDILSVTDCLSRFEYARGDERFIKMITIIEKKADEHNRFTPESIYQKYSLWDFGQKKVASPWLTYQCLIILKRCGKTLH